MWRIGVSGSSVALSAAAAQFCRVIGQRFKFRTFTARRFSFVSVLDALISIAGGYGTQQQLVLASAIEIPVLPVPCFGGRSRAFWDENRSDIQEMLSIDNVVAKRWET